MTLEVPRPLTIVQCGVRFMRTDFDHFSTTSPANALRFKVPGEGDVPILGTSVDESVLILDFCGGLVNSYSARLSLVSAVFPALFIS